MSKEFKIKLKKDIKINIKQFKLEKMLLKIKGKNENGEIFVANIIIKFQNKNNVITVKKINIKKLEIENSSDELSCEKYGNIYCNINSLISSSSSSQDEKTSEIYNQLIKFAKNIKLYTENDKVIGLYLTLKNTNIKKMKLRGLLN